MNHDQDMRREQKPGAPTCRGVGMSITMLCGKCHKPKQQLGSKRVKMRGVLVAVCRECVEAAK